MIKLRNMNENSAKNFNKVQIGGLDLYFSYETLVAFEYKEEGLIITENIWQTTTGKHLNWISRDKSIRIPYEEFKRRTAKLMSSLNI